MTEYEPFDPNSVRDEQNFLVTNRLLAISLTIYTITFLIVIFHIQFGMSHSTLMAIVPIALIIALGLNIAGLVKGIYERKENWEMAANGIIGNLIPIILAIIFICYLVYVISSIGTFNL